MSKKIAIMGAGASGLMCAITALKKLNESGKNAEVVLFEKNARAGKKLLMTGNGKCNFTNTDQNASAYHSNDIKLAEKVLSRLGADEIIDFFENLGICSYAANGTCVYPRSMQAASVLDALRFEAERLGTKIISDFDVKSIQKIGKQYEISNGRDKFFADAVIIASGSGATCGSDDGIKFLKSFGHKIYPLYPALTALKCDTEYIKTAQGMRAKAAATLRVDGKEMRKEDGEVLFCDYGISGIAVMQLSGIVSRLFNEGKKHDIRLSLDLASEFSFDDLCDFLKKRAKTLSNYTLENFLGGFLNKRVALMVTKAAQIGSLAGSVSSLKVADIKKLTHTIKNFEAEVSGVKGAPNAQVMGGGASLGDFDADTLMSKHAKGLFACGEVLDVYGDCGGYNLTWAWASGYTAGLGAANII